MSPDKKPDNDKGGPLGGALGSAVQTIFGPGPGQMPGAQEVVQLLAQILNQVKEQAAFSAFKPPPLSPEATAAVQQFRLIRAALDYPARDRAQIPASTVSAAGTSQTGSPVAQVG